MELIDAVNEITKIDLLKNLTLSEPSEDSQFGVIKAKPRHFKDAKKNELILNGNYNLFLAHMYKDIYDMEEFFYITFSRLGEQRNYRCRTWFEIEYAKVFASGSTIEKLVSDLKEGLHELDNEIINELMN